MVGEPRLAIELSDSSPRVGAHNVLVTNLLDNVKGWKSSWFFVADPGNFPHNWTMRVPDDKYEPFKYSLAQLDGIDRVFQSADARAVPCIFPSFRA